MLIFGLGFWGFDFFFNVRFGLGFFFCLCGWGFVFGFLFLAFVLRKVEEHFIVFAILGHRNCTVKLPRSRKEKQLLSLSN